MVDTDLIEVNVNDWFGGVAATAWVEWWQNYGTGRELRPDDPNQGVARNQVSGAMQLYLLAPRTLPRGWLWNRPLPDLWPRADRALSAHAFLESLQRQCERALQCHTIKEG
jgi:hypothetical protein